MAGETRRTVTVVFSDVSESTSLGEQLDPEALRRVMARYFEEMRTVLERHGGTVEKFIGDAVMAVFGIPELHEDDAVRAVRAAVEMREALARLNEELRRKRGVTLEVRTGVNTGEVVAGDSAEGDFYATGDAVNVAARLEQAAAPGEILVGGGTRRLVRDAVELEPVDSLELKGKADSVPAYRLLALVEEVPVFARRFDTPFVGRERELAGLRESFERAAEHDVPILVTVLGTAGIGKTRLAAELVTTVEEKATALVGRCLSYGEGITYWPLEEILRSLPERPPEAPDPRQTNTTEETFWAYRKLFEALAQERPLVLLLEDVHWAEPTLLDLVEHVAGWTRDAPLLILCLARPELLDERPGWPGERIELEPLGHDEAESLVTALAPALAPDARARAADAAEGNPLFLEQLLSLAAEEDGDELAVPPTIQALLAARIDRLPPEERAVIEPAAVVGKEFWRSAVVDLAPEGAEVSAVLQRLVRKEFIRPDRSALPGEDGFRFGHQLIRDATYAGIPKETRTDLHERVADWLERTAPELDELVGHHLEQAYRYHVELAPPGEHAEELAGRAAGHLSAAGRRAYLRGDVRAAVNLLERAAALLADDDPRRLELAPTLAGTYEHSGRLADAEALLAATVERANALGQRREELLARVELAAFRFDYTAAASATSADDIRAVAEHAIGAFEELGDDGGLARAWTLLGLVEWGASRWAASAAPLEEALFYARRAADRETLQIAEHMLLTRHLWGPTPAVTAIALFERRLEEVQPGSDEEATAWTNLGALEALRGNLDLGRELYRRGMKQLEELGLVTIWNSRGEIGGLIELSRGGLERRSSCCGASSTNQTQRVTGSFSR
jgi:class 3 adenylate cyclase